MTSTEDDPRYPVDLNTTEGTISSILRQKGAAAEEARAPAVDAKAAEEARAAAEAKAAELVAARAAKEKHQLANVHDVVPMVMEREEVRKEVREAERKVLAAQEARKEPRLQFRGPCKDFCKERCACCVSADGRTLYGCVPIAHSDAAGIYKSPRFQLGFPLIYILPLCLHMCLCPQQGGDPCPVLTSYDECDHRCHVGLYQLVVNPLLCCYQSSSSLMYHELPPHQQPGRW